MAPDRRYLIRHQGSIKPRDEDYYVPGMRVDYVVDAASGNVLCAQCLENVSADGYKFHAHDCPRHGAVSYHHVVLHKETTVGFGKGGDVGIHRMLCNRCNAVLSWEDMRDHLCKPLET